jgi:casein kinase II subunit beta
MYRKYKECEFGVCPLLTCEAQPVLPVGLKDDLGEQNVLVYCPRCKNVMVPAVMASSRYEEIELDGAYFGSTFPHLFFLQHPHLLPPPPLTIQPYVPKVFGFRVRFPTEEERLLASVNHHDEDQITVGSPGTSAIASRPNIGVVAQSRTIVNPPVASANSNTNGNPRRY